MRSRLWFRFWFRLLSLHWLRLILLFYNLLLSLLWFIRYVLALNLLSFVLILRILQLLVNHLILYFLIKRILHHVILHLDDFFLLDLFLLKIYLLFSFGYICLSLSLCLRLILNYWWLILIKWKRLSVKARSLLSCNHLSLMILIIPQLILW